MPRDWDARTYDRVADPMTRWGETVLERLPLAGDERVLDAGCGSGRVTEQLAERLSDGQVVALDGSPAMVDAARERLARFGARVEYVVADLGKPLAIEPVDAILSTATFHWVPDHAALFRNLAAVLHPGGRLVAQCGGAGNIASIRRVLATLGDGWLGDVHFETSEATTRRLEGAVRVLPAHGGPRKPPRADAAIRARRLRPCGRRRAARSADRLRPAQYRRAQGVTAGAGQGTGRAVRPPGLASPGSRRR
jgi:trans-aconitate 2-methyltransferase